MYPCVKNYLEFQKMSIYKHTMDAFNTDCCVCTCVFNF